MVFSKRSGENTERTETLSAMLRGNYKGVRVFHTRFLGIFIYIIRCILAETCLAGIDGAWKIYVQ